MVTKTEGKVFATMNVRRISPLLGAIFVGLTAIGASNCADQRAPECTVSAGFTYAVRLVETGGSSGDCTGIDPLPSGDEMGLRPFVTLGSDQYADYDVPQKVAIQMNAMGVLQADAEARLGMSFVPNVPEPVYAYGQFTTPTPESDICTIPTFAPGRLTIPALPAVPAVPPEDPEDACDTGTPERSAQPPLDITAEWSNMRVLVTTGYPGTQFEATLTYTVNTCTRTYAATGVFGQALHCEGSKPSDNPECEDPVPSGLPDDSFCTPENSGINPDFPVACDAGSLLCVLAGPFGSGAQL